MEYGKERASGYTEVDGEAITIPVVEESLVVGKRLVETGKVRLTLHAEEHAEVLDVPLTEVRWHVEHVPVNRVVDAAPEVRVEGDTTIYPVMEERVVVRRELVVREEVRVTRRTATNVERVSETVRREKVVEERLPADSFSE